MYVVVRNSHLRSTYLKLPHCKCLFFLCFEDWIRCVWTTLQLHKPWWILNFFFVDGAQHFLNYSCICDSHCQYTKVNRHDPRKVLGYPGLLIYSDSIVNNTVLQHPRYVKNRKWQCWYTKTKSSFNVMKPLPIMLFSPVAPIQCTGDSSNY